MRLRPNVLAAPLRTPAALVREVAALQLVSAGRFELGLGAGRPDAAGEAARLGMPWGSASRRRDQVLEAVAAVRAEVDPVPEIVIAAAGPRMLAAAAAVADRVVLAAAPHATERDLADMVAIARDSTDRDLRFSHQLVGVGDRLPYRVAQYLGLSADGLRADGAAGLLDADSAAEVLAARREKYGIDEAIVPGELAADFAPIPDRCGTAA